MRLIVAGGGTGGHLFPGLAVAREFLRRHEDARILFVGSRWGIESRVIPQTEFPLELLPIRGLKGRGLKGLLEGLYGIPLSLWRSRAIIRRFDPQCIIGLGGYASGPLLLAGVSRRIRCAVLEQNLRPGLTNRVLGRLVDRIFTSFRESVDYFPADKVVLAGTPVRWRELPEVEREAERFHLLVFGGSAGARRINEAVLDALAHLGEAAAGFRVMHQSGRADEDRVRQGYASLPCEAEVLPFIEQMDRAYAAADLVVCRAGASTLAELTLFGKPAVLIPYPYAAHDHQRLNALALEKAGAAVMIVERELSATGLAETLRTFHGDAGRRRDMGEAAARLGRDDAAERIVDECHALVPAWSRHESGASSGPAGKEAASS